MPAEVTATDSPRLPLKPWHNGRAREASTLIKPIKIRSADEVVLFLLLRLGRAQTVR